MKSNEKLYDKIIEPQPDDKEILPKPPKPQPQEDGRGLLVD